MRRGSILKRLGTAAAMPTDIPWPNQTDTQNSATMTAECSDVRNRHSRCSDEMNSASAVTEVRLPEPSVSFSSHGVDHLDERNMIYRDKRDNEYKVRAINPIP